MELQKKTEYKYNTHSQIMEEIAWLGASRWIVN